MRFKYDGSEVVLDKLEIVLSKLKVLHIQNFTLEVYIIFKFRS